jgi:septal ring-binding cell division protein DamX
MVSRKIKVLLLLLVGLLSACASPATAVPVSQPTEAAAPTITSTQPTEAATSVAVVTETSAPTVESSPTSQPAAAVTPSFVNDVLPILEGRCVNCHGGDRTEEGLNLKTHSDLLAGSDNGAVVIPNDADHSKLVELIMNGKMPKRGPKLTPPQIQLIVEWINQGALEN